MRGEQCVWSREGRGAEAKAVKEERPAPLDGKSREHLRARLREKLPDRQQCGAMERQEGLDISNLLIFFPSGGLRLMRKSQNYSELDAFRTASREDAKERQSLMVDTCP